MIATASYVRELRDLRGLTQEELAKKVRTSVSQIVRIEKGEIDTRSSLLARIIAALEGNGQRLITLLVSEEATVLDGRRAAIDDVTTGAPLDAVHQLYIERFSREEWAELLRLAADRGLLPPGLEPKQS